MQQKEGAPILCSSMGGSGEHYAKWNKPGGERQIPYDLTCKWNIINKMNKQAKYDWRQWSKEQTDKKQDDGGVNGSYTNLLPEAIWNYSSIGRNYPEKTTEQ